MKNIPASSRYARQELLPWLDQDRLSQARILIAGMGALGNEVSKNLALLGVGNLLLIDFDRVEVSNLSKSVLFESFDIGQPKVKAAERSLHKLSPELNVIAMEGDLSYDLGLGFFRHADLVVGCVDSLAARSQLSTSCKLAGVPYLDGAMWAMGGEVRWFMPGDGPCFDCMLGPRDRQRLQERFSCTGFRSEESEEAEPYPTLISTSAIIAGILAQEAVKWLCGLPVAEGKAIVYNGQDLRLHRAEIARNPDCSAPHRAYEGIISLSEGVADISPRRLFALAREHYKREKTDFSPIQEPWILELGRDVLVAFECPECGQRESIFQVQDRVTESARACPNCGANRQAELLRAVDEDSPYADHTLSSLGISPGEILLVHGEPAVGYLFELVGDLVTWNREYEV
uniref:Adenylyltransferase and sulfurtransferase n=1 Tax=Candidatus Kentrum sp. FM TaxID=2126340 RepID=A0A450SDT3_9GAMM|nr:MAG: adenylyltransferase and sulfurtransferase [Candidatus Kentron sp. FM]VFJ50771.1 MAG: adenylyltransferase and sulfurtransferase [Candidatus Kentron sp. FM]VFK08760.1 MAG: adenylyltransferase and sulfurtransferase [Candidatus Kentron sp. FM]